MSRHWDYLASNRVHCVDCVIDSKFRAGWVLITGFTNEIEMLCTPDNQAIASIIIPSELRRQGTQQRFFDAEERIEFDFEFIALHLLP